MYRITLKAEPGNPARDRDIVIDDVYYFENRHDRLYVEFPEDRDEYGGDHAYFDMAYRTAEIVWQVPK